ncbi:MAG TPA: permease prefix domain 1-containing protein [Terriglobia bacterium]|nr:permease prefix domain 1-containing protein [Terriglobia bacterium]
MIHDFLFSMRALFRRSAMEAELDGELRAHLEHQVEKHMRRGLSREEAETRARFDLGDLDQIKEECRRSWGVQLIDELASDVRLGLRQVRRNPVFSTVSALALILGILANTMMFDGLTAFEQRLSPQQQPASPVLAAQNSVPKPVKSGEVHRNKVARKVPSPKPARARTIQKNHDKQRTRSAPPAREKAPIVTAGFFFTPGAVQVRRATWISNYEETGSNGFVLISETWQQSGNVAIRRALEVTVQVGNSCETVVMEVIPGNPRNLQEGGWRPFVLNARAAMSNATQGGALAVMEQSGQCTSVSESLSNL